jgi:hypothetical protein
MGPQYLCPWDGRGRWSASTRRVTVAELCRVTHSGSLANLLWRRTMRRRGLASSARTFHTLSALITLPAVLTGVVVLWAWAPVVR